MKTRQSATTAPRATAPASMHLDLVETPRAPLSKGKGARTSDGAARNEAYVVRDLRLRKGFGIFASSVLREGSGTLTVITPDGPRTLRVEALDEGAHASEASPAMHPDVAAAVARARVRGEVSAAAILDAPDMLRGAEMAERMGMSRQAVHKAASDGRLLALTGGSRDVRYPAWQLDENGARLGGVAEVISTLGQGWPSHRFLVSSSETDQPNWQRLAAGEITAVLADARAWAQGDYG